MSSQIRLLIVEDVPEVAQYMRMALASQGQIAIVDVIAEGNTALLRIPEEKPDVVIVDALLRGATRPLAVLGLLRELGIPGVVVTVPQTKVPVDHERGIAAVVTMPFLGHDLVRAIHTAHETSWEAGGPGRGRIVAVYGPKGGVGRTTLAFNLAAAAAAGGRKTLLVDGNFQFGELRTVVRAPKAPSILDLPTDVIEEDDLTVALHRQETGGFDILLAPPRIEMADLVTPRDVEKTTTFVKERYEAIVVDLPVALTETTLGFLDVADAVLVVVTDEPTAVANGAAILETFVTLGYPDAKRRVVVNRAGPGSAIDVAAGLGVPEALPVTADPETVRASLAAGVPFVSQSPDAQVSRDVTELAAVVVGPARAGTRSVAV